MIFLKEYLLTAPKHASLEARLWIGEERKMLVMKRKIIPPGSVAVLPMYQPR
jgi:hypothetical protein